MLAILSPTTFVKSSGYFAIFVLSVLQSCCVPTSSELTLGFAGVLAEQGELSLPGAIVAGAFGEVVGAYIAWFIGRTGGRAFVDRFGRYILLSHRDLDRAEAWYRRHSRWGVFGSRLLPVVRNFVALPAGVAEVPLGRFGLFTAAGSLIWDGAMALIGYEIATSWKTVIHGFSEAGYVLAALAVVAIAAFFVHRYRSYKAATTGAPAPGRHARRPGAGPGPAPAHAVPPAMAPGTMAPTGLAVGVTPARVPAKALPPGEVSRRRQP
ncbi:MAG: DedA family protein [Acidimicrobiales bacterium]